MSADHQGTLHKIGATMEQDSLPGLLIYKIKKPDGTTDIGYLGGGLAILEALEMMRMLTAELQAQYDLLIKQEADKNVAGRNDSVDSDVIDALEEIADSVLGSETE